MKTSIFNMSFTLPPMIEMTEVVQETPSMSKHSALCLSIGCDHRCFGPGVQ